MDGVGTPAVLDRSVGFSWEPMIAGERDRSNVVVADLSGHCSRTTERFADKPSANDADRLLASRPLTWKRCAAESYWLLFEGLFTCGWTWILRNHDRSDELRKYKSSPSMRSFFSAYLDSVALVVHPDVTKRKKRSERIEFETGRLEAKKNSNRTQMRSTNLIRLLHWYWHEDGILDERFDDGIERHRLAHRQFTAELVDSNDFSDSFPIFSNAKWNLLVQWIELFLTRWNNSRERENGLLVRWFLTCTISFRL